MVFVDCHHFVDSAGESALAFIESFLVPLLSSTSTTASLVSELQVVTCMKTETQEQQSGCEYVRTLIEERKRLLADLRLGDFKGCTATDDYRSCKRSLEQAIRDLEAVMGSDSGRKM